MLETARLFFALWPDHDARGHFERAAKLMHQACGGKVTRSESIHLTLAFLGSIERAKIDSLLEIAASVEAGKFELVIDRLAYWKHNKIAWAGSVETPPALSLLVKSLGDKLRAAGFQLDSRPFATHVTLLRHASPPKQLPEILPFSWHVDSFCLIESTPTDRKIRYDRLGGWSLKE